MEESKIGSDWSFTRDSPASRDAVISALPFTLLPSGRAFAGHENTQREMQLFSSVQNRGGRRRLAVIGHHLIDENRISDLQAPPSVCPFSSPSSNVKSHADRYEGRVLDSKELDLGILDQVIDVDSNPFDVCPLPSWLKCEMKHLRTPTTVAMFSSLFTLLWLWHKTHQKNDTGWASWFSNVG